MELTKRLAAIVSPRATLPLCDIMRRMERRSSSSPEFEQHGPLGRALLIATGCLIAVSFSVLAIVPIAAAISHRLPAGRSLAMIGLSLGCLGIAWYGISLTKRGIRGRSRQRFARAQAWLDRRRVMFAVISLLPLAALLSDQGSAPRVARLALLGAPMLPLLIALHEIGHAVSGVLLGFRFQGLSVGWASIHKSRGRIRVGWRRPPYAESALGLYRGVPIGRRRLRARLALNALAGPAMTLASGAACAACATWLGQSASPWLAVIADGMRTSWWLGLLLAVGDLVPLSFPSGLRSDGALVLAALTASPQALQLTVVYGQGLRPREWGLASDDLIAAANADLPNRETLLVGAVAVALDLGEMARAEEILGLALQEGESRGSSLSLPIELEAMLIEAFRGEAVAARPRFARMVAIPGFDHRPLAEAAIYLVEGKAAEANDSLAIWESMLAASEEPAMSVGFEWAHDALRARLAGTSSVPPPSRRPGVGA